jgi:N,N-dimethylformamidase beta subunit-like protein
MASIEGFCWPLSAAPGETIDFFISAAGRYTVQFVRFSNNDPAVITAADICNSKEMSEHLLTDIVLSLNGTPQQPHTPDQPCSDWDRAFQWPIPSEWASGIFAARCSDGGSVFYINFVVKPDPAKRNPLLVLANVNTWNAYNIWGGWSHYANAKPGEPVPGKDFTYLRPNPTMNLSIRDDLMGVDPSDPALTGVPSGSRHLTRAELWVLNWMQEHDFGFDVCTDLDWHNGIDKVDDYESVILNTHPEYWTTQMYQNLAEFLDNGGNLIYLGGNAIYEQVEISPDGQVMHCFDNIVHKTGSLFRDIGMPESALLGIRYVRNDDLRANPYTIRGKNRFCTGNIFLGKQVGLRGWNVPPKGTRLEQGGASGWEIDRVVDTTSAGSDVIAEDPPDGAQMVYFDRYPGSFVLSAGSLRFGGSLIVDGDLQTIVSNALTDRRVRLAHVVGLGQHTEASPALAYHNGHIFIAWRAPSGHLRMTFSGDGGSTFGRVYVSHETSDAGPSLASHNDRLYIAWKGIDDQYLNVAKVSLFASTAGAFGIEGIEENVTLSDSSSHTPALASHHGLLFLGWKGVDNENLNVMFSDDDGANFQGKHISSETSSSGPALVSHQNALYIAWTSASDGLLNVAKVGLLGNTAGGFDIDKIQGKITLGETSDHRPALASSGALYLAWVGFGGAPGYLSGYDYLNVLLSSDGGNNFWGKGVAYEASWYAPAICAGDRVYSAWVDKSTGEIRLAAIRL